MAIERWLARQEDIVVDKLRYRISGSDSSCSAMKKESQEHVPCSLYINFLMQLEPANQAFDHSAYAGPLPWPGAQVSQTTVVAPILVLNLNCECMVNLSLK